MSKIMQSFSELIGSTPIIRIKSIESEAFVSAKLEYLNPAGSVKDRVAKAMIDNAEKNGLIKPGDTVIEPTSGNTGIGLAAYGGSRGYKIILTMPKTMSVERRQLIKAYGAEIVLTDGTKGMSGAIQKANDLAEELGGYIPGQFDNPANPEAHYKTTGPEIWEQTKGNIDIFIAGVGTGGTITGVGRYLKKQNKDIEVIAVEPYSSPVLSGGKSGAHGIQGIGAGFVPSVLDTGIYDEIITVKDDDAYQTGKMLADKEGLLVGISSGAAAYAAYTAAARRENRGKNIVVLFPDTGGRYLSTPMFND